MIPVFYFEFTRLLQQRNVPVNYGNLRMFADMDPKLESTYKWQQPVTDFPVELPDLPKESKIVFAFATYVWNFTRTKKAAEYAKAEFPNSLVILGGPQMEYIEKDFFEESSYVDFVVHKEGEQSFVNILKQYLLDEMDYSSLTGVSYMKEGILVETPPTPRIDLSQITESPYEKYFDVYKKYYEDLNLSPRKTYAVLETNRGCPYSCAFCNWGAVTASKINLYPLDKVKRDAIALSKLNVGHLHLGDANFGIHPRDFEVATMLNETFTDEEKAKMGFSINYAKNFNENVIKVYDRLNNGKWKQFNQISVSVQSLNEKSLKTIKRDNIGFKNFVKGLGEAKRLKNDIYTDLIIGLPHETYQSFIYGAAFCLGNGVYLLNAFNLMLLPGTYIYQNRDSEEYGLTYEAVNICEDPEIIEKAFVVTETRWMNQKEIFLAFVLTSYGAHFYRVFKQVIDEDIKTDPDKLKVYLHRVTMYLFERYPKVIDLYNSELKYPIGHRLIDNLHWDMNNEKKELYNFFKKMILDLRQEDAVNKTPA